MQVQSLKIKNFIHPAGRVLGVTAISDKLNVALDIAYNSVSKIHFDKMHYRKDIGQKALKSNKIQEELICY